MALTFTEVADSRDVWGKHIVSVYDIDLDASYPTGGEAIAAADVGLNNIESVEILPSNAAAGGYQYVWDTDNDKLMVFRSAGFTPAGTNSAPTINVAGGEAGTVAIGIDSDADDAALSKTAATARIGITGVQAPTFTGAAVAAAVLAQVSNGVDLSAVNLRCRFIGN